ncbi:hypothetical protein GCM10009535_15700 [Streptomyces thermocarboxydovorans]|uniref:Uncharacterized protein n=1 Tax=Streptomyces thermocarboxydovorans TaxID=59298 RepID=A0ABP3SJW9_9ACTN
MHAELAQLAGGEPVPETSRGSPASGASRSADGAVGRPGASSASRSPGTPGRRARAVSSLFSGMGTPFAAPDAARIRMPAPRARTPRRCTARPRPAAPGSGVLGKRFGRARLNMGESR